MGRWAGAFSGVVGSGDGIGPPSPACSLVSSGPCTYTSEVQPAFVIDLSALAEMCELPPATLAGFGFHAAVVLLRARGSLDDAPLDLHSERGPGPRGTVKAVQIERGAAESQEDLQESTEHGGAAVGIGVASSVFNLRAFRRLPKGTHADFLLRVGPPGSDSFVRLEVSGVLSQTESPAARLREKVARYKGSEGAAAMAIVAAFRSSGVQAWHSERP